MHIGIHKYLRCQKDTKIRETTSVLLLTNMIKNYFICRKGPRNFLRFLALVSLLSVIVNTPKTFQNYPFLIYITYAADWVTLVVFVAEMISKINHMGLISDSGSYLKNR